MVLAGWSPSGAALYSHHECALSQIGTRPGMALYVARTKNNNTQQAIHAYIDCLLYSKASLNRRTMGPALIDPFRQVIGLGTQNIITMVLCR